MSLPQDLRQSLQRAYLKDFGRELTNDEAETLGSALIRVLAPVFLTRAVIHRSESSAVDDSANKRDALRTEAPNM